MREIKFRAWDKESKLMYKVFGIDANHAIPFIDEKNINKVDILAIPPMREQTILMQYTGLKDKHGKEIYEGDIILDILSGHTGVVYYDKQEAGYFLDWNEIEKYPDELAAITPMKIGNIFENPELLEVEK